MSGNTYPKPVSSWPAWARRPASTSATERGNMHSDKCIIEPPAHGNAQSACLDFAVEFLRDDGAAFRSTSTFFEVPEHMESVNLAPASLMAFKEH